MRIFVTGTAGFIGFHLAQRLIARGHDVAGFDGMTPYYDVRLKQARIEILEQTGRFRNTVGMLEDAAALTAAAERREPEIIVHLAAQAGVRSPGREAMSARTSWGPSTFSKSRAG
jgi:UDP-glucuronate 4-epimerase